VSFEIGTPNLDLTRDIGGPLTTPSRDPIHPYVRLLVNSGLSHPRPATICCDADDEACAPLARIDNISDKRSTRSSGDRRARSNIDGLDAG
jgi:hypothetical protein